jgi:hypothetical protein
MLTKLSINLKIYKRLFETITSIKKQTKIHNTVYFSTNLILKDEIKKE